MPDPRPIGLFDSGVGGLSVLREIVHLLPGEDLLYFADTANCPYGPRPAEAIIDLSHAVTRFLLARDAKLVVVACNTASAAALTALRAAFPIPFVGMVPAVKPAAAQSRSRRIGVLATEGTVQGRLFSDVVERFADGVEVHTRIGHGLVELVERGEVEGPVAEAAVAQAIGPLLDAGVDTLALGCTHYPFLAPTIERVSQGRLAIIEPSTAVAAQTRRVLTERDALYPQAQGRVRYFTSGDPTLFKPVLLHLMGLSEADVAGVVWDGDAWQTEAV